MPDRDENQNQHEAPMDKEDKVKSEPIRTPPTVSMEDPETI